MYIIHNGVESQSTTLSSSQYLREFYLKPTKRHFEYVAKFQISWVTSAEVASANLMLFNNRTLD